MHLKNKEIYKDINMSHDQFIIEEEDDGNLEKEFDKYETNLKKGSKQRRF